MFGYLNVHTHYSLLQGVISVKDLVQRAKKDGCDALAITDSNNMYGAVKFYKAAKAEGVKPILGVTLFLKHGNAIQHYKIILLAKDLAGYKSIMRATTVTNSEMGGTPSISFTQLERLNLKNVIAILPPENNPIQMALIAKQEKMVESLLLLYQNAFGKNIYLGISPQDFTPASQENAEENQTDTLVALAKKYDIPCIPLPLIYLLREGSQEARKTVLRIQRSPLSEREQDTFKDLLIFPERDAIETWCREKCPEALQNLSTLIEQCNCELEIGKWIFPVPPVPEGETPRTLLEQYIEQGLSERDIERTEEVNERITFELETIAGRGYLDYFIIVIDLVRYMHKNGILTTTRGSAAGSLISYLAGITSVNPLQYNIPFERFLNPYRPSPPDIDIDIADDRRNEVIEYISERYGKDKVAQIGTLGTLQARASVRDTARALGYSYISGDRIARLIPFGAQGMPMYIDRAMEEVPEIQQIYDSDQTTKHIIDVAKEIEGNPRHNSVHAAGMVIAPSTITEFTPLEQDDKADKVRMVSQYDMYSLEDIGLIKFDILGISYLSILAHSIELVEQDKGVTVDIDTVPEEPKVYQMISSGYTTGVFQLGGSGMTSVLKKLKPTNLYDIAAVVALYRPGPMGNIDEYIARKKGERPVVFFHPKMKKFLEASYGVLVYQDDLLYTAIELAGYNWEEVDVFRKAVGKKIPELMEQQEGIFKKRVAENTDLNQKQIDAIWNLFDPFAGYGFNKAHAMCYAKLAYQTAYMKHFHPVQYMTAHLQAMGGNIDDVNASIYETKKLGISINPPDINNSLLTFSTEKNNDTWSIRIGLSAIKQVGTAVAEKIIQERNQGGSFNSIVDFISRMAPYNMLNKKSMEALVKVGVFDTMEQRGVLLENMEEILSSLRDMRLTTEQTSLFDSAPHLTFNFREPTTQLSRLQELHWERELMGLYASGHPFDFFRSNAALSVSEILQKSKRERVKVLGIIGATRTFVSKKGEKMNFLTIEDKGNNTIEALCDKNIIEKYEELLGLYRIVYLRGEIRMRNDEPFISVEGIENVELQETTQPNI